MHQRGMIHGDLKGVGFRCQIFLFLFTYLATQGNILIDQTGNARLGDFGLLTIISSPANLLPSSSLTQAGTARWMSPELVVPQEFGLKAFRPTKSSDCYALGMVVYEVIYGNIPFHKDTDVMVIAKILKGDRPRRRLGFSEGLWKMLERCWAHQPNERPSVEDILRCLDMCSSLPALSSSGAGGGVVEGDGFHGLVPVPGGQGDENSSECSTLSDNRSSEVDFGVSRTFSLTIDRPSPLQAPSPSPISFDTPPFANAGNLSPGDPFINTHGVMNNPQSHIVRDAPISGGTPSTAPTPDDYDRARSSRKGYYCSVHSRGEDLNHFTTPSKAPDEFPFSSSTSAPSLPVRLAATTSNNPPSTNYRRSSTSSYYSVGSDTSDIFDPTSGTQPPSTTNIVEGTVPSSVS